MGWLTTIIIGIVAGWLAGQISKSHGFGIWGDLLVGIIGSFIGNMVLGFMGIAAYGIIGNIIAATAGALILLWVVRLFRPAEPAYKK
jgi:uncharacterized membrane protein YeaQ/YmgE (transglycosylase-associated protein family)